MTSILESDMSKGIGQLFREKCVRVPYYQRSYAWKRSEVKELYEDFRRAIDDRKDYYFLGSVVGCQEDPKSDEIEIVDGQQRLATTAILLAAIRNRLNALGDNRSADKFEETYLFHEKGFKNPVRRPSIVLNEEDDGFFQSRVIGQSKPSGNRSELRVPSHRLIDDAAKAADSLVTEIVGSRAPNDQKGELDKWVEFIKDKARIIFIVVNDPADAFMIFETLNDRGLDLTVADLTKNYLLMKAGKENVDVAKSYWSRMKATLATASDSAEITKVYIHHLWSSYHGVTRDKELFKDLRNAYDDSNKAIQFTQLLSDTSPTYAALANSDSDFWNDYGRHAKRHLAILNSSLKATQVRMLLLAVVDRFKPAEVEVVLTHAVWWSVRFLVAGGSPSKWEAHYASRAKAIRGGQIATAAQLIESMANDVPGDESFKAAFAEASVSKAVGRYFLNCFERERSGEPSPHLAIDDPKLADREHILPESPDQKHWPNLAKADHERLYDRIGNHALLTPDENKKRQNSGFITAQAVYLASGFQITQDVGRHKGEWDEDAIQARQNSMAELAVEIWPLKRISEKKPKESTAKKKK